MINVILVDENDRPTGTMEKLEAHRQGRRHRAISCYVFNSRGWLLLQLRAVQKYHAGGLWSNTCCGHPFPGEETHLAATRRLHEEMGMHCQLHKAFEFSYRVELDNGMVENEFGHIFLGTSDLTPQLNPAEAEAYAYVEPETLRRQMAEEPARFTPWFLLCYPHVLDYLAGRE
ncbi:isopentenyl-diphosphate Delta-isomerase [Enterobacillus tribolii]|uniref:Isopentenyl-diphosphate Delta-isomerase n=1 Tax=Enterobacillus tribolii TaxID=1487935 RepID=A0A370QUB5_9GAMM|nr:isopentenyl-diphosphate Delta-isomerase [Enterobacillus tribolii]MBW7981114.1 isopentenyl-diphosphate Delta-isomerase [Enterobacillus tribolii]RDK92828.1 isopentenyl-diphosphate delta-isomerase [Enterobacillus tribolii]